MTRQYEYEFLDSNDDVIFTGTLGTEDGSSEVGRVYGSSTVSSVRYTTTQIANNRRYERSKVFSETVDKMNPTWYNSLSDTDKTSLETWRVSWLNYPDTGVTPDPTLIANIFGG